MSNKIGRFEILGELSRSEIGAVYKASDPESGQTIALKMVQPEALGEESAALIQGVLEEAAGIQALSSHNLTQLYGAQEMDGQFCAAMEYVQGNSVATMLARKEGFSIWDLQDIARQSCQGLDHAHTHHVLHYSLEPAKIMVTWDGTVKILSFGISRMGTFGCHGTGKAPEVLHYMSPEQLRGERVDARSNLFSLGAILYEMVTEQKAFPGEDAEQVRRQIFEQMPAAPVLANRKLHPALSEVIMKALAKAPEARYQNGQELINDLERCKESPAKTAAKKPASPVAAVKTPPSSKSAAGETAAQPVRHAPALTSPPRPVAPRPEAKAVSEFAVTPSSAPPAAAPAGETTIEREAGRPGAAWKAAAAGFGGTDPGLGSADLTRTQKLDASEQFIGTCGKAAVDTLSQEQGPLSSTLLKPESAPAKITVDPMMAEESKSSEARGPSFSEITELPPLKEAYVPPPPPPAAGPQPAEPLPMAAFRSVPPPKPKVQPRQVARKAVTEIKKTPPKLFMYSVAAAVGVIVLVVGLIAFRIHSQNSEDSTQPQAAVSTAPESSSAAGHQGASRNVPAPTAVQAQTAEAAPATAISVTPKYNRKKTKALPVVPAVIPGQLTINSTPEGAEVSLDERHDPNWITPFNMSGLMPGQHTVKVSKPGFSAETRSIEVASGSKSFLVVQLAQVTATVSITSEPAGAAVFVDGRDTGRVTPVQISVDKPGTHTFMVKKQGYLEETTTASLQAGQLFRFAPSLKALGATDDIKIGGGKFKKIFGGGDTAGMGAVSLKTQPKGAQVAVNRRILDKASPVEFYLNPGTYVIDITMTGYKDIHRVINVEKGGKMAMDEAMERQ